MDISAIKQQMKERRSHSSLNDVKTVVKERPRMFSFLLRLMVLALLFLGALIYTKSSTNNKQAFYDILFKDNLSFAPINDLYNKYLGGILPFKDIIKNDTPVFKEKLVYSASHIYNEGVALTVANNYLVPVLDSGIIVFVGEKEGYGKTVIVQQVNGVDVWYGNVDNLNAQIYDYVEGGSMLGEAVKNKLYLVFKKDGKVLDYKDYL